MEVDLLVEGVTDEIFVRACYRRVGIDVGTVFGKRGVDFIRRHAVGYAERGRYSPILIMADFMDVEGGCPPEASRGLVPHPHARVLVALPVNEVEGWVLASRQEIASYLAVAPKHVPVNPDSIADPKLALVNLARRSRRKLVRQMIVPKPGLSGTVGTGYVDAFSEFMNTQWDLDAAIAASPSFGRFVRRSREMFT